MLPIAMPPAIPDGRPAALVERAVPVARPRETRRDDTRRAHAAVAAPSDVTGAVPPRVGVGLYVDTFA